MKNSLKFTVRVLFTAMLIVMVLFSQKSIYGNSDEVILGNPQNACASSAGNLVIKLEWDEGNYSGITDDEVRYLVYRSDSYDGNYIKIGYTPKGEKSYFDGGGDAFLEEGKIYYYKIQAYDTVSQASSTLYDFVPISATASSVDVNDEFYEEQDIVAALKEGLINREKEITIDFWASNYEKGYHRILFSEAVADAENKNDNPVAGDYLRYHITNYDAEFVDLRIKQNGLNKYRLVFYPTYFTTYQEEMEVNEEVERILGDLNLNDESTDYEKVKAIYDYLCSNESYSYDLSTINNRSRSSAYDTLILNKAVCQGFSITAYRLMKELGIVNRMLIGSVYYGGEWRVHAWNYVLIDGKWYHLDSTTEKHFYDEYSYLSYRWFLKKKNDMRFSYNVDISYLPDSFFENRIEANESVVVPLEEVISFSELKPISSGTIAISWNKINRANGYELYRSTSYDGYYEMIKDISGRSTADKEFENGVEYFYKVRAYETVNNHKVYGDYSKVVSTISLKTPLLTWENTNNVPSGIELSWDAVKGATKYAVYRSDNDNTSYYLITDNLKTPSFTDKDVKPSSTYYYKVQAYNNKNNVASSFSNERFFTSTEKTNSITAYPSSGVTIRLSWNKQDGANYYYVYRSLSADGDYKLIKTTTTTACADTGLAAGTRYYYKISTSRTINEKTYYTLFSDVKDVVALTTCSLSEIKRISEGTVINWTKASGASGYNVYRSETVDGSYSYLASVANGSLNYTDNKTAENKTYYYRVRAYKKIDGKVYYGGYSDSKKIIIIKTPELAVKPSSGITMRLSWNDVDLATVYEVYRSIGSDNEYEYLKATTQLATADTNLTAGTKYNYRIRAGYKEGETWYYSSFSEVKSAVTLAMPQITAVTQVSGGTMLSWTKASGADRYNIYRSTTLNGNYEYVTSVLGGNLSYNDDTVDTSKTGAVYYYKVRAYKRVDGIIYYGGYSDAKSISVMAAPDLTISPSSGITMRLSWTKIDSATKYEIYRYDNNSETFSLIKGTTETGTADTNLSAGHKYDYRVRACRCENGIWHYSDYSVIESAVTLAPPILLSVVQNEDGIVLNWTKASGADRYNIYRSISPNGKYEYVTSVLGGKLDYTDTTIDVSRDGVKYYYKVRAYKRVDGIVYYGGYSDEVVIEIK